MPSAKVSHQNDEPIAARLAIVERYRSLYSGQVFDALEENGLPDQILDLAISPMQPDAVVAGWVMPVRGGAEPRSQHESAGVDPRPPDFFDLIARLRPGDVITVDCGGERVAGSWGELTSTAARARGCVGVMLDGGTRDTRQIRAMDFPVFARYGSCVESNRRWAISDVGHPIFLRGANIARVRADVGDFLFGDADGVLVIPADHVEAILAAAEGVAREEAVVRDALAAGEEARQVFERLRRF